MHLGKRHKPQHRRSRDAREKENPAHGVDISNPLYAYPDVINSAREPQMKVWNINKAGRGMIKYVNPLATPVFKNNR